MKKLFLLLVFLLGYFITAPSTLAQPLPDPPSGCGLTGLNYCTEYNSYDQIDPYVTCNQYPQHCCPTQSMCISDDQADRDGDGVPDLEDNCPNINNPQQEDSDQDDIGDACEYYPNSSENCGVIFTGDPVAGTLCLDSSNATISNYVTCSSSDNECCRDVSYCPTRYGCNTDTGTCEIDSRGEYRDFSRCDENCVAIQEEETLFDICLQVEAGLQEACTDCMGTREDPKNKFWSAFGCFSTDSNDLVRDIIRLALGLAGGLALLLILTGAFIYSTSTGNPERTKLAQEIITAAIAGLIFIILSVAIFQFTSIELLRIPGLNG